MLSGGKKTPKLRFGFETPFILDDDGGVPGYQVQVTNTRNKGNLQVFVTAVCLPA